MESGKKIRRTQRKEGKRGGKEENAEKIRRTERKLGECGDNKDNWKKIKTRRSAFRQSFLMSLIVVDSLFQH